MKYILLTFSLLSTATALAGKKTCAIPDGDQNWQPSCKKVHIFCSSKQLCHRQMKAGKLTVYQSIFCNKRVLRSRVAACLKNPKAFGL